MRAPVIDFMTPEERDLFMRALATAAMAWARRVLDDEAPVEAAPEPPRGLQDYPLLLKVEDLSEILRVHPKTILAATVRGEYTKMPSPALIGPYRWRRSDVETFLTAGPSEFEQRRARAQRKAKIPAPKTNGRHMGVNSGTPRPRPGKKSQIP